MIRAHFGLDQNPFARQGFSLLCQQQEIFDTLRVHCQQGGLCVVVGDPGTGKSVVKQALCEHDPKRMLTPVVNRTLHTYHSTLRILCEAFQIDVEGRDFRCERRLIEEAQRCGYTVALYIVALNDPTRLLARVAQRVREGGHPVPPERVLARYPRTMDNLAQAVRQADVSYLYDAAEATGTNTGPQLVAVCSPGTVAPVAQPLPTWAQRLTAR